MTRPRWLGNVAPEIAARIAAAFGVPPERWQVCERKRPYSTRKLATRGMHRLIQTTGTKAPVHVYACPYGDHWHVGHKSAKYRAREEMH